MLTLPTAWLSETGVCIQTQVSDLNNDLLRRVWVAADSKIVRSSCSFKLSVRLVFDALNNFIDFFFFMLQVYTTQLGAAIR